MCNGQNADLIRDDFVDDRVGKAREKEAADVQFLRQGFEDSKGDLTFGVGVRYDLTPKVAVRAQWQRYLDMGGPNVALGAGTGDLSSVDVLGVGFFWRFQ